MSLTRLSSNGSLPNSNWAQQLATTGTAPLTIQINAGTRLLVQQVRFFCPATNTQPINIGPDNTTNYRPIAPGAEVDVTAQAGATFDLAQWYYKINGSNDVLVAIFQP